jgi:hypothetical protein
LRDGSRGEGFDIDIGAGAGVVFFVPARKSGEEEEGDEGEDDGDDAGKKLVIVEALEEFRGIYSQ